MLQVVRQGAYGGAMVEYMTAYSTHPEDPLTLLCIGTTYLNQAVNRKVPDRDAAILAAFAFLQVITKPFPIVNSAGCKPSTRGKSILMTSSLQIMHSSPSFDGLAMQPKGAAPSFPQ